MARYYLSARPRLLHLGEDEDKVRCGIWTVSVVETADAVEIANEGKCPGCWTGVEFTDVHTDHCCRWHGCKYGDEGCTVVTGVAPQEYPCEECDDTEDWRGGGLRQTLNAELARYGLPDKGGLTALLRHLEGNRSLSEGFGRMLVERQSQRIVELKDAYRHMEDIIERKDLQIQDLHGLLSYLHLYTSRHTWTQLTTDQKELFADIIDAHNLREFPDDPGVVDRWWRE